MADTKLKLSQRRAVSRNREHWDDPVRRARTLESLAESKEDGGENLLAASRHILDSDLRGHVERHADDEIRHAAIFRDLAMGAVRSEEPERALDLSRSHRDEMGGHGFYAASLCDEFGEVAYVAMLHVAEQRAKDVLEVHRALNREHPDILEGFEQILRDAVHHIAYTGRFLDNWRADGRGAEVDKALRGARSSRFVGAWKRLGIRSGAGFSRALLYVMYWTVLLPFGFARWTRRQEPVQECARPVDLESQYLMRILGISAFHSDAAAALVIDGKVVAAAQEERFTRKPLDPAFPRRAIRYCLHDACVRATELDRVVFYEKPIRRFERVLATQMQAFPRSAKNFAHSAFHWLGDRLWIKNHIASELGITPKKIAFTEHAVAAAANAFLTSPFAESSILTIDDVGEWATTTLGRGLADRVELLREVVFPDSLGLVVSAFTQYLGFVPGEDESKIEALSAYGRPTHSDAIAEIVGEDDGFFRVDQECFRYVFDSERLYSDALTERLGPPRFSGDPLCFTGEDRRHADIAASLQAVIEVRCLALARTLHELAPSQNLCLAGEMAKNTRVVARLANDGPFRRVHVASAPGKAGGAIGAALFVHHHSSEPSDGARPTLEQLDLGEAIDERTEPGAVSLTGSPADVVRDRLLAGQRIAWVRGRMEFGTLSHGHRSVLADPRGADARRELLATLQKSEPFLPCRIALPSERAAEFLEFEEVAYPLVARGALRARARPPLVQIAPSAVEPDGLAWVHLVAANVDAEFHRVLTDVAGGFGVPIVLHTEFAPRGAPIVRNEAIAVDAFRRSGLDCLVVASRLYERS